MSKPTRFPYGQALGFSNQFRTYGGSTVAGNTAGNISGSATPNVSSGELFYTNNTAAVTITHFELDNYARLAPDYEGKIITVVFLDTATQLANSGRLFLSSTNNLVGANNNITLMHSRSGWYELNRSYVNRTEAQVYTINGSSSINVDGVSLAIISNTGAGTTKISALSGGQVGQTVYLTMNTATSVITLVLAYVGNIQFPLLAQSNAMLIDTGAVYGFTKVSATRWYAHYAGTAGV